jgi:hypothetical protein
MKGFAIDWTAEHTGKGHETTYAVGSEEKNRVRRQILEAYDGSLIKEVRAIAAGRARWITQREFSEREPALGNSHKPESGPKPESSSEREKEEVLRW